MKVASNFYIIYKNNQDLFITLKNITNTKLYIYKVKYVDLFIILKNIIIQDYDSINLII